MIISMLLEPISKGGRVLPPQLFKSLYLVLPKTQLHDTLHPLTVDLCPLSMGVCIVTYGGGGGGGGYFMHTQHSSQSL